MRRFVGDPLETSRRPSHHDAVSGLVWHHRGSDGHGWITYVVHKEANVSLRLPFNITVNMSHGGGGGGESSRYRARDGGDGVRAAGSHPRYEASFPIIASLRLMSWVDRGSKCISNYGKPRALNYIVFLIRRGTAWWWESSVLEFANPSANPGCDVLRPCELGHDPCPLWAPLAYL